MDSNEVYIYWKFLLHPNFFPNSIYECFSAVNIFISSDFSIFYYIVQDSGLGVILDFFLPLSSKCSIKHEVYSWLPPKFLLKVFVFSPALRES